MNKESSVWIMLQYTGPWTQMKDWSYEPNPDFLREYKIIKWNDFTLFLNDICLKSHNHNFFILTLPLRSQTCYHLIRSLIGFKGVLCWLFHSTEEKEKCMGQIKICKRELLTAPHTSQCKLPDGMGLKMICQLISSMLGNRKITTATLVREPLEAFMARGCLQGVVLWLNGVNENACFTQGYADEIPILISGKFLNNVSELLH